MSICIPEGPCIYLAAAPQLPLAFERQFIMNWFERGVGGKQGGQHMQKPQAGEYRVYQGRTIKQFKNQRCR